MTRHNLVNIDDIRLRTMLADVRFTQAVPCLAQAAHSMRQVPRLCGRCSRKQAKMRAGIFCAARNCIAALRDEQLETVKKLLSTKRIRVTKKKNRTVVRKTL